MSFSKNVNPISRKRTQKRYDIKTVDRHIYNNTPLGNFGDNGLYLSGLGKYHPDQLIYTNRNY